MSEPFLAEIRLFGFNYAPPGWAMCDGQILPINQYQSLYSLLGTMYGGDGETTFALPDLRGRAALHLGTDDGISYTQGERGGAETVTLSEAALPAHSHGLQAFSENAATEEPEAAWLARAEGNAYVATGATVAMHAASIISGGGGQAHENMQPYLAVNYCIALQGLFPSET